MLRRLFCLILVQLGFSSAALADGSPAIGFVLKSILERAGRDSVDFNLSCHSYFANSKSRYSVYLKFPEGRVQAYENLGDGGWKCQSVDATALENLDPCLEEKLGLLYAKAKSTSRLKPSEYFIEVQDLRPHWALRGVLGAADRLRGRESQCPFEARLYKLKRQGQPTLIQKASTLQTESGVCLTGCQP